MCHYHFRDKRDLILALVEGARADWVEPLERLLASDGSPEERARAVVAWTAEPATAEVMKLHSALFWMALHDDAVRDRLAAEYARWRQAFIGLFVELAKANGDGVERAAGVGEAFASAADGLVQQQALDPSLPTEKILSDLLRQILPASPGARGADVDPSAPPIVR
jgi:AcrR family transcriptional regulator